MNDIKNGFETVRLKDYKGNVYGEFAFNPSDPEFVARYAACLESIKGLKMGDVGADWKEQLAQLRNISDAVKAEFDELLGEGTSDMLFKYESPCALANGEFAFEQFLILIGDIISERTENERKAVESRISKYTAKYKR